jgi:hypothetical protein
MRPNPKGQNSSSPDLGVESNTFQAGMEQNFTDETQEIEALMKSVRPALTSVRLSACFLEFGQGEC